MAIDKINTILISIILLIASIYSKIENLFSKIYNNKNLHISIVFMLWCNHLFYTIYKYSTTCMDNFLLIFNIVLSIYISLFAFLRYDFNNIIFEIICIVISISVLIMSFIPQPIIISFEQMVTLIFILSRFMYFVIKATKCSCCMNNIELDTQHNHEY